MKRAGSRKSDLGARPFLTSAATFSLDAHRSVSSDFLQTSGRPSAGSTTCAALRQTWETIDPRGSVMEQLGFVRSGVGGGQAFERVPQHHVAAADFVHREV